MQTDALNVSRIATVIVVPMTSNLRWADAPGNVLLRLRSTGLPKDAVANVQLVTSIDRSLLTDRVGRLSRALLRQIQSGIALVVG